MRRTDENSDAAELGEPGGAREFPCQHLVTDYEVVRGLAEEGAYVELWEVGHGTPRLAYDLIYCGETDSTSLTGYGIGVPPDVVTLFIQKANYFMPC